jgi:hypothetical protein
VQVSFLVCFAVAALLAMIAVLETAMSGHVCDRRLARDLERSLWRYLCCLFPHCDHVMVCYILQGKVCKRTSKS